MSNRGAEDFELTPELLLRAYTVGVFPMAESRHAESISWIDPRQRGILPLDAVHVPKKLAKTIRRGTFEVRCNTAFADVIATCAEQTQGRRETWINPQIESAINDLHRMGYAHSVESWRAAPRPLQAFRHAVRHRSPATFRRHRNSGPRFSDKARSRFGRALPVPRRH